MESFNPTPEWLGQGRDFIWGYAEIWGFPVIFAAAAFAWAAPQVQKSLSGIRKAEYEIASPIDDDIRAARERFQKQLDKDAAEAEKIRKEEEERKRQEKLEELKTGPKTRKDVKGRDYNPLMANSEGMGGGGGRMGRVKPCPPGG